MTPWMLALLAFVAGYFARVLLERFYLRSLEKGRAEIAERLALEGLTAALDRLDREALVDEPPPERPEVTH